MDLKARYILLWLVLGAVSAVLLTVLGLWPTRLVWSQPNSYTYTIAATSDSAVTMGDMADTLSFIVTNTGNDPSRPIDSVRLEFDANLYDISNVTAAPDGWSVDEIRNAGQGQTFVIYVADTTSDALEPGESQTFTVGVLGRSNGAFEQDTQDQTDALEPRQGNNGTIVRSVSGNRTFDLEGDNASWLRRGLAVDITALPPAVAIGDTITVQMLIDNRSLALQQNITRTLTDVHSGLVTLLDGPTPLTLTLPSETSDIITYTYQATADGIVTFQGNAANIDVTSDAAQSEEVVIGDLTALLEISPNTIIAGQDVTVRMRVYNNTDGNLGNVRPSALQFGGDASVLAFSGPSPTVVPSLPAGSTTTFEWTYTLSGTVGSTFVFTGTASATGPLVTNVARSNSGTISQYMAYVTPRRIGSGTATPLSLAFVVANNGATPIQMFEFTIPPGFADASGSGQTTGNVGVPCTWNYRTNQNDFQPAGACSGLPPGGTAALTITFSSIPSPAVDTNYNFGVDFCSGTNNCRPGRPAWEGAVDVPFTITRYRVQVTANPSSLPADGYSTSEVTAVVYDGSGAPVPGAAVVFASTGTQGTLSAYNGTTDASGALTVTFTAPVGFVNSQAIIIGSHLSAEGQTTIALIGINGPNPLYVGGTLAPVAVQPGETVAFSLDVINTGNQPLTLTTASVFTFTDGARTFSANLAALTTVPTDTQRTLTFAAATVDASFAAGAYFPSLRLVGTAPGQVYNRSVSDPVSVGLAALAVRLSAAPTTVSVGQAITVTGVVTNVGLNPADNATVALAVNGSGGYVSGPIPASIATLNVGSAVTFTWIYTGTAPGLVSWTGVANGTDAIVGIPVTSSPATSNNVTVMRPAELGVSLVGAPPTVNVGQTVSVTLQVNNNGDAAARDVTPDPLVLGGTGGATYVSGPAPALVAWLAGGDSTSFVWTFTATAIGTVNWSGGAGATDANAGWIITATATSNDVAVQTPAAIACSLAAGPINVDTGYAVTVTMTVTNSGGATAQAVTPSALTMGGTGSAAYVSSPAPASANIPGGSSATFVWTYNATNAGTVNWDGSASGQDANSGAPISTPGCTSNDVTINAAAYLVASLSVAPDAVGQNEDVVVTMLVTNTGTVAANGVTPSALVYDGVLFPATVSGPTPASADIPGGGTATFVWQYRSANNQTGSTTWSGSATGTDAGSGNPVSSASVTSNLVTVYQVLPAKSVQKPRPASVDPGEWITYTITIRNTGNPQARLIQITDTLPVGFVYQGDVDDTPPSCSFASTPSPGQSGTLTWNYNGTCRLNSGQSATVSFLVAASSSLGDYCNGVGVTVQGALGTITRGGLACVRVAWPEYLIAARVGVLTIQVRVRIVSGKPEIVSWQILR